MNKLKEEKLNTILVIVAFIFNILIFAPIEIFLTNQEEFWFGLKDFVFIILYVSVFIFLILYLISKLLKNKNWIINRIVFALTIGLYIQGNFLNFGYGTLDGSEVNWNGSIYKGFINLGIWIVLILLPYAFKKLRKKENFNILSSIVSIFILLIELITLTTVVFTSKSEKNLGLSNKNIFNMSKKDNIVVMMSDTFEGTYMNQILDDYPEYKEKLKDFIYFDNCTGVSFFTFSSMPTLLTGVKCEVGNNLQENLDKCFNDTDFYKTLKENGYDCELYLEKKLTPKDEKIDNLSKINEKTNLNSKIRLSKKMYKYVLYRYLPHFLKPSFNLTSDEFNEIKSKDNNLKYFEKIYHMDDVEFNKQLLENGLTVNNRKKVFKFIELNGLHLPYTTTRELVDDKSKEYAEKDDEEKRYEEALAALNLLVNYIEELKKADSYDNTTIVLLADHGYHNRFYTNLLVKKAGDNHDFEINSAPVTTIEDLIPTILNLATNSKDYGKDFFDYKEDDERTRIVEDFTYETAKFTEGYTVLFKILFKTEGKASDEKSFIDIGEEYKEGNKELKEKYQFNELISFKRIKNLTSIGFEGIATHNINDRIIEGCNVSRHAKIIVNREMAENKDVEAVFEFDKIYDREDCEIIFKIDENEIYKWKYNGIKKISFNIPKDIWNKNEQLVLELEIPNAKLGEVYPTTMTSFRMKSLVFKN